MSADATLLAWLLVKHFLCDFPLQAHPWLYSHKGEYGHPGGIVHAAVHYLGTLVVLAAFGAPATLALGVAGLDGVIHYHVDWAKMRTNAALGLGPTAGEGFWILLGFDQLLHHLTYVAIVWGVA